MSVETDYHRRRKHFGVFGGRYVPEPLWEPLEELWRAWSEAVEDEEFVGLHKSWRRSRLGRPTPLTHLRALSKSLGGAQLWAKREDLVDGASFCVTSALSQALLAKRMGKGRIIGETATGDFGVALGTVGTAMGLEVVAFMGRAAMQQEPLNVTRMRRLGVEVVSVDGPGKGRSHAMAEALRQFAVSSEHTFYATSSLASPDPYPTIVARALSVIGDECRRQTMHRELDVEYVVAPVGSGSFAAGLFSAYLEEVGPQLVGVQSAGESGASRHAASLVHGRPGVHLGTRSLVLQDEEGQILAPHSAAWGLAMPVAGPQHARWLQRGDVHYVTIADAEADEARRELAQSEAIWASRESGYGLAYAIKLAPTLGPDEHIVVGISGAGVRDLDVDDEGPQVEGGP